MRFGLLMGGLWACFFAEVAGAQQDAVALPTIGRHQVDQGIDLPVLGTALLFGLGALCVLVGP